MSKKINPKLNDYTLVNQGSAKDRVLIVILGPTASGKSKLAVKLAKKFGGEVISADSRQIYRGMSVGTGKITPDTKNSSNFSTGQAKKKYIFTYKGIPHYCIDVAKPERIFTVAQYRKLALETIEKIFKKDKILIICGGTGFYIQAVVDGIIIPGVEPDWLLRMRLNKLKTEELFKRLKNLDSRRAKTIDKNNRRRLIRALEIVIKTKKPTPSFKKSPIPYPVLMIGLKKKTESKIIKRVNEMFKQGLEKEVRTLVKKYGWVPTLQTIGYQEWKEYFEGKISKREVKDLIVLHTRQYIKRQMTWFKRDRRIKWIKNYREAEKLARNFLEIKRGEKNR